MPELTLPPFLWSHRPLDAAEANFEYLSSLSEAQSTSNGCPDRLFIYGLLAALVDPCCLGLGDTLGLPFSDHAALKLSHCPHHAQHQILGMVLLAGEKESLLVKVELHAASLEVFHQLQQVLEAAGEAVDAVDVDGISLADIPEHLLERWAIRGRSA